MDVKRILTRTSNLCGGSTCTSWITKGSSGPQRTAASDTLADAKESCEKLSWQWERSKRVGKLPLPLQVMTFPAVESPFSAAPSIAEQRKRMPCFYGGDDVVLSA